MSFTLLPRAQAHALAAAIGESERSVHAIVIVGLMLALAAGLAWALTGQDPTLLAGHSPKTAGSARVLRGFMGLGMVLGLAMVAGITGLGHWMLAATHRARHGLGAR